MTWQLALGLSILAGVARMLILRRYAQASKAPATFPPAASSLFGVLPVGLFAGLILFPHSISWSYEVFLLMIMLSVSMAISSWLGFITAGRLAVAPQQTIGILSNVSVVLLGWTLLGEGLSMWQFVGGGLLLVATTLSIFAPVKTKAGEKRHIPVKTLVMAISSAVLLAIGLVAEKALLKHMDIGGIFLVSWTMQSLGMVLLAAKDFSKTSLRLFKENELRTSTAMGILNGLSGVCYVYAIFHSDNISLVTVLGAIGLPLTVLGAYLFLREREHHLLMWLSVMVSILGLYVMSL